MNRVYIAVITLVIVSGGVIGYVMMDAPAAEDEPVDDSEPLSGEIERFTADFVSPGSTVPVTVEIDASPATTITLHERVEHDEVEWYNITVRDAESETVRYDVRIPSDIDADEVIFSGHATPDGLTPAEDSTITVRPVENEQVEDEDDYWDPDYIQLLPATGADYNWEELHDHDADELPANAIAGADAVYESPDERITVSVITFVSDAAAEAHLSALSDRYDTTDQDGYTFFERDETEYRAWIVANLYLESQEDEELIELIQNAIMEERGMPLD